MIWHDQMDRFQKVTQQNYLGILSEGKAIFFNLFFFSGKNHFYNMGYIFLENYSQSSLINSKIKSYIIGIIFI